MLVTIGRWICARVRRVSCCVLHAKLATNHGGLSAQAATLSLGFGWSRGNCFDIKTKEGIRAREKEGIGASITALGRPAGARSLGLLMLYLVLSLILGLFC